MRLRALINALRREQKRHNGDPRVTALVNETVYEVIAVRVRLPDGAGWRHGGKVVGGRVRLACKRRGAAEEGTPGKDGQPPRCFGGGGG
jgi:hypothetical protein